MTLACNIKCIFSLITSANLKWECLQSPRLNTFSISLTFITETISTKLPIDAKIRTYLSHDYYNVIISGNIFSTICKKIKQQRGFHLTSLTQGYFFSPYRNNCIFIFLLLHFSLLANPFIHSVLILTIISLIDQSSTRFCA